MCVSAMSSAHRLPRLPGDAQDDERDAEADERISNVEPNGDDDGAGDNTEAHVGIGSGVVAVGDQSGAVEPVTGAGPDLRGDPVADKANSTGSSEHAEPVRSVRVEQTQNGLVTSDASADEDRGDNEQSSGAFSALGAQEKSKPNRDRSQSVTEIVDQVG